jgi:hypothetical protein
MRVKNAIKREKNAIKCERNNRKNDTKYEIRTDKRENVDRHISKSGVNVKRSKTDNYCTCYQQFVKNQKF